MHPSGDLLYIIINMLINMLIELLWVAPELLGPDSPPPGGSQPGDVYSFSIILQEIIFREGPYFMNDLPPKGINCCKLTSFLFDFNQDNSFR